MEIFWKTCCESGVNDVIDKVSDEAIVEDNAGSERKKLGACSFW